MNPLDIEIREKLASYLANEISIEEFKDWFVPATWEVEKSDSLNAIELASEIDLRLAEFSNGHWTEDELKERLRRLVGWYTLKIPPGTQTITTGSSGITTFLQQLVQHAGIVSAKVRG